MQKILVVDDDYINRELLKAILEQQGFEIRLVENGQQAVEQFECWQPDLVLMDINMPVMDGYQATKRIKSMSGDNFVPVIFLTAITDDDSLVKCVESGGDDFLTKPYNNVLLKARIDAFLRIRNLYGTVQEQHQELIHHQERLERERQLAKRVFSNILESSSLDIPIIKSLISPLSLFSGDVILAASRPSGGVHVLLGDFSGHGLAAATGALPVSSIFYSMTEKGYSVSDIVAEIDSRLKTMLPDGMFLAACMVSIDPVTHTVSVWNGGLPPLLIYSPQNQGEISRVESAHLPLGIANNENFSRELKVIGMQDGDRIYITSDGVTEAMSPEGKAFGEENLLKILKGDDSPKEFFDIICRTLREYQGGSKQRDDAAFIEIEYQQDILDSMTEVDDNEEINNNLPPTTWDISMTLGADLIRHFDPLPMIMQSLGDLQGFSGRRQELFMVFSELFSNALDHGILELDSALKESAEGFTKYYEERASRLENLVEGEIKINIQHRPVEEQGGELTVRLEDSGSGFDFNDKTLELEENMGNSGRGIQLIRSRCVEVGYKGSGNIVEAVYRWQ